MEKKLTDDFITCEDCGAMFFLSTPEENRRRYEQHLQFCTKKKRVKAKQSVRKRVLVRPVSEPES